MLRSLLALANLVAASFVIAADLPPVDGLAPTHVAAKPLEANWVYSRAGGEFTPTPPAGAPPKKREGIVPLVFRGTFTIVDPKKVGGLWVRIAEPGDAPRASICTGDLSAASGGYYKDLGYCPTLLDATLKLNGRPLAIAHGPLLTPWLPVEGELVAGENMIELAGNCYTYWERPAPEAIVGRLAVAEIQPPTIYNGPLLGDFGTNYFTVGCRTNVPADLIVTATPTSPPGSSVSVTSPHRIWHRLRVELPAGTTAATYTLEAKVDGHATAAGPFTIRFPDKPDNGFRFVALGNIRAHTSSTGRWANTARLVQSLQPTLVAHTGNCNEHGTWEFKWQFRYFDPAAGMLASVPTLLTPCYRDTCAVVDELFCTPNPDMYGHNWSKAVGPVRFVGIDSRQDWKAGGDNASWLESELAAAKERFIFVLCGYPAFSSGKSGKDLDDALLQRREVVMKMLGKHRATAMLSGSDSVYERCEPPSDAGCTQIVCGAAGKEAMRYSGPAIANNPYAQGKGRDWAGAEGTPCLSVFDVTPERVEMKTISIPGDASEPKQLDARTFLPR